MGSDAHLLAQPRRETVQIKSRGSGNRRLLPLRVPRRRLTIRRIGGPIEFGNGCCSFCGSPSRGIRRMKRLHWPWPTRSTRSGCSGDRRRRVSFAGQAAKSVRRSPRSTMPKRAAILENHIARIDDRSIAARVSSRGRARAKIAACLLEDQAAKFVGRFAPVNHAALPTSQSASIVRPRRARRRASRAISGRGRAYNAARAGRASRASPDRPTASATYALRLSTPSEWSRQDRTLHSSCVDSSELSCRPDDPMTEGSRIRAEDLPSTAYEFERAAAPAI